MRLSNIGTIFKKEMTDTVRDRRTLIFMLLVPIVAIPLLIMLTSSLMISSVSKAAEEKAQIVIEGFSNLPPDLQESFRQSDKLTVLSEADFTGKDLLEALQAGEFQALVSIPENFQNAVTSESTTDLDIFYDKAEMKSEFAVDKIKDILDPYREELIKNRIEVRGLSTEILNPFDIRSQNVASAQKVAGKEIGAMLPYLIIIMCFMGAMYPAIDLAAGEKERGTLETLLVSPATRGEFVVGKYLVILTTGVVAALLSMASLTFSLNYMVDSMLADLTTDLLAIQFTGSTVILIFMIILPLAGIFASILLSVSIFARSFKEAQSYITGLNMLVILPAFISFLPGVELDTKMALIPVVNASLIIKDAISGTVEWQYVIISFVSTLVLAGLCLVLAKKWFERESVLFRM